jgi:diguanylate cyclase (GGDEF)-like protein
MAAPARDRAYVPVRIGASMFFAGALFSVLSTVMPHGPNGNVEGLRWLALAEALTGVAILAMPRRWRPYIPSIVVFGAVAVVSVSVACNGEQHGDGPTMTEFFYTWPAVYVGYFFERWMTPVFIAVTGVAYGATLAVMGVTGNVEIRWLLVVVVVAGLTVASHAIRTQVDGLVRRLEETARTDTLTSMPNRRAFDERLALELERTARTGDPLSLLIGDIDRFKALNDRFGHAAGDAALASIGRVLISECRAIDTPARIGGEEFAVLLPSTDATAALTTANRLREAISRITDRNDERLTISFGVAVHPADGATADDLIAAADHALYAAKAGGRDRAERYVHFTGGPRIEATPLTGPAADA